MSESDQPAIPPDEPAPEGGRSEPRGPDRLLAALRVAEEFETSGLTRDEFLNQHGGLRDLLEVMLRDSASTFGESSFERLGEFELVRRLGAGGSGIVYEALQLPMERRVAVKKLIHGALDERARVRFQREARLCASVQHPNIVRILSFGHEGEHAYLAMELVAGVPLAGVLKAMRGRLQVVAPAAPPTADIFWAILDQHLSEQGFAASEADRAARPPDAYLRLMVKLMWRVADALAAVHCAGIVHRDVKPANILLRGDGVPMLTDFGVAREQGELGVTFTGEPTGTWYYLSPEQLERGPGQIDSSADVFALGVSVYEALTQRRPFDGADRLAVTEQILHTRPLDPRRLVPSIDRDLAAVVMKALQRDSRDRYRDAGAMSADLAAWLGGAPVQARPLRYGTRLLRWVGRNRVAAGTIATFAVLSLILAVTLRDLQRRSSELEDARVLTRSNRWSKLFAAFVSEGRWAERSRLGELRTFSEQLEANLSTEDRIRRSSESDSVLREVLEPVVDQLQRDRHWLPYVQKLVQVAEQVPDQAKWDEVRRSIAAKERCIAAYRGLESLADQQGLVPLEINAATGLWEFWHQPSGSCPVRENGRWVIGPQTGMVFVLIPPAEGKPAFFIAAHELTQGQWSRLAPPDMPNPSTFPKDVSPDVRDQHPVETVAPERVARVIGPWGLAVPSLDEWGDAAACVRGELEKTHNPVARDEAGAWKPGRLQDYVVMLGTDGVLHARVGTCSPNPYGLYDVLGNVWDLLATPGRESDFAAAGGATKAPREPADLWLGGPCKSDVGVPSLGVRCVRRLTGR